MPTVSSAKKTISESVFRRNCATKALSTRSADTTTPNGRLLPGSSTGTPTAWYSSSPASPGSSQSPWVICPSIARPISAPREKSSPEAPRFAVHAWSRPAPSVMSTQSAPVCSRSSSA